MFSVAVPNLFSVSLLLSPRISAERRRFETALLNVSLIYRVTVWLLVPLGEPVRFVRLSLVMDSIGSEVGRLDDEYHILLRMQIIS